MLRHTKLNEKGVDTMNHCSVVKPLDSAEYEYPAHNRERYGNSPKARVALRCEVAGARLRGWCVYAKVPSCLPHFQLPPLPPLRQSRSGTKLRLS